MPIYVGNDKVKPNGIKEVYLGYNKVYSAQKYYYYIYFMKDGVKYYTKADTTNLIIVPTTNINEATAWDISHASSNEYYILDSASGNYWRWQSYTPGLVLSNVELSNYNRFTRTGDIFNEGANLSRKYLIYSYFAKINSDGTRIVLEMYNTNALTFYAEVKED